MYSLKSRSLQWHKIGTNVLLNNHLYSAILSIKNDLALKCLHYRSQWLPKSFSSLESCLDSFRPFPLSSSSSSLSTMFQNTGDLCNIIAMHLKDQAWFLWQPIHKWPWWLVILYAGSYLEIQNWLSSSTWG